VIPFNSKITITGDLGSGKSALSRILCERIGFEYISTGQVQRQLAREMGIDTLQMNRLADSDPSIDKRIDGIFISLGHDPKGYVIDSRLAWFFLPNSYKIYLKTDIHVAARRILEDPKRNSEQYATETEAIMKISARKQSENTRFLDKYGADCTNLHNFDLVIDTTKRNPESVADLVQLGMKLREQGVPFARFL